MNEEPNPYMKYPAHRPRCKGHDYYERGIYLITIVVRNRDRLFGELNMDVEHPGVNLTPIGRGVLEEWEQTADIQRQQNRHVTILGKVVMPDHFHGVLFVEERMDVSVGHIISGFKAACTHRWRLLTGCEQESTDGCEQPCTAADGNAQDASDEAVLGYQPCMADDVDLHRMSKRQRQRYYATLPRERQPLFDDNYDDTCLIGRNQLEAMIGYVKDNPRRAILKRKYPEFMQRRLCITINGTVRYAAFGNLLLLRNPMKQQVFCHRMARVGQLNEEERQRYGYVGSYPPDAKSRMPYVETEAWTRDRDAWIRFAQNGGVLVTPGISPGERDMKNIAINCRLPLIHLQAEPITADFKPEGERFYACAEGSLLILAPWVDDLNGMPSLTGAVVATRYDRFHNMNRLAGEICRLSPTLPLGRELWGCEGGG